jgi:hypothetical protein
LPNELDRNKTTIVDKDMGIVIESQQGPRLSYPRGMNSREPPPTKEIRASMGRDRYRETRVERDSGNQRMVME